MSISINSSAGSTNNIGTQYENKINQLKIQMQTYEAQLQTESDLKKQTELKEKIQNLQNQIKNYQAKAAKANSTSNITSIDTKEAESKNAITSSATVEISKQGKAFADSMKVSNEENDNKSMKTENE
jgi:uncharacterized protein involved in exopolysaccharide biosynthesis